MPRNSTRKFKKKMRESNAIAIGCEQKRFYASTTEAGREADRINEKSIRQVQVYPCENCEGFHVGGDY